MPVVISYNPKAATAAKIGVERDVGNLLLLGGRVEADETELLGHRGLEFANVIPHSLWSNPSTDVDGVWQILTEIIQTPRDRICLSDKFCYTLHINKSFPNRVESRQKESCVSFWWGS